MFSSQGGSTMPPLPLREEKLWQKKSLFYLRVQINL